MKIFEQEKSDILRTKYIDSFVNKKHPHYIDHIETKKMFSDGLCYTGYLWDCLKNSKTISEDEADTILSKKHNIFVMWDIHSCDRIFIPNYWKFPKSSVLSLEKWEDSLKAQLPEDIYVFDETFSWSVIYTHEDDSNDNRWCIALTADRVL